MTKDDGAMLKACAVRRNLSKVGLQEFSFAEDSTCDYCGLECCDLDHILWECPHFRLTSVEVEKELAIIVTKLLCKSMKRGVAQSRLFMAWLTAEQTHTVWWENKPLQTLSSLPPTSTTLTT